MQQTLKTQNPAKICLLKFKQTQHRLHVLHVFYLDYEEDAAAHHSSLYSVRLGLEFKYQT